MRRLAALPLTVLLLHGLVGATFAARPDIIYFAGDDVADSLAFSQACGFAVTAQSSGHVIFHNEKQGATQNIANYNINIQLTSANGSYHLIDAGPDMILTKFGVEYLTLSGRSLTGSGVIGRVEVNLATGELTWHGNLVATAPFDVEFLVDQCAFLD
jgi:hypothetical protein